jgi:hypothetical protein
MDSAWLDDSPHARFIRKLKRRRVDSLLQNKKLLSELRYDWEALKQYRSCFQEVWQEREIDLFDIVMCTSQTARTPPPPKEKKKTFSLGPLASRPNTRRQLWVAFENRLPTDVFELLMDFLPEPEPAPEPEYDAELADEWALPHVKVI